MEAKNNERMDIVAPSRERGLKRLLYLNKRMAIPSRSFAGAWIETADRQRLSVNMWCRSFAGAWIETPHLIFWLSSTNVAPSRERGLKPVPVVPASAYIGRSLAGAWIETL